MQVITQRPILEGAQLGEAVFPGVINERVFVNPPDPSGVRAKRRVYIFRQLIADLVQIFEDARTRPVDIGAVFENHAYKRKTEEALAPGVFYVRRGGKRADNRVRNLVFHNGRSASRPFGENDHLHVGKIRDGVERDIAQGEYSCSDGKENGNNNQETIVGAPGDEPFS